MWRCPLTGRVLHLWHLDSATGSGSAKTSLPGRKTVLRPSNGWAGGKGVETSRSENETRLVAEGPSGSEPGGLPRRTGCQAWLMLSC